MATATETRERPILYSGEMVRAIYEGKSETRRLVQPKHIEWCNGASERDFASIGAIRPCLNGRLMAYHREYPERSMGAARCPYGEPGDLLWARESYWKRSSQTIYSLLATHLGRPSHYFDADLSDSDRDQLREWGWRHMPSIHMPRCACRLRLRVLDVRGERLWTITRSNIDAEGMTIERVARWCDVPPETIRDTRHAWQLAWDHINGDRAPWDSNPLVWVVRFQRDEGANS